MKSFEINSFLNIYKSLVIKTKYTKPHNVIVSKAITISPSIFKMYLQLHEL